ncbi:hypothetical protein ACHAPM_007335 [Fusarium culmorum]
MEYKRKLEEAIRRLLARHEGVARAGRVLQRDEGKGENPLYDPVPDFEVDIEWNEESGRKRTVGLDEDKRAMMDDNGNPKAPNYWSGHDPQVLSLRYVVEFGVPQPLAELSFILQCYACQ